MDARAELADSLTRRYSTQRVAAAILELEPFGLPREHRVVPELRRVAAGRGLYGLGRYWGMEDDFDRPVPATRQLKSFEALFPGMGAERCDPNDADAVRALAMRAALQLRPLSELGPSQRRATRKRMRFLRRLDAKTDRLRDVQRLRRAQMQAKSRLAYTIDPSACDDLMLALCAYATARANRRSVFMVGAQSRARDTIVEALEALQPGGAAWSQYALVSPTREVIARLAPGERGKLIGVFHAAMADAADALAGLWPSLPERMRAEMVMVKGVDSSRWNAYAGALNTMRMAWLGAVRAAGLDEILADYCPGKAPRLMAADVAWMYRNMGEDLHEDTRMFGALPHPWDVVREEATLGRERILEVAAEQGVDAEATGWVGKRARQYAERPEPDPALVHGVVVGDPLLAVALRRCGAFSGKRLRFLDELPEFERGYTVRPDGALIPRADVPAAEREHSR